MEKGIQIKLQLEKEKEIQIKLQTEIDRAGDTDGARDTDRE